MNGKRSPTLADGVLAGDPRAIARAISVVEDESADAAGLARALFAHTGRAYLIGVTGPPGAGKSTLVDRLTTEFRRAGRTVGVLAVDPTSPFSGGAVLGDRLRMQRHAADEGVFIRSMATRGHLGGLARATGEAALVLDAAGKDIVIIETVGVGQDEVEIVRTADICIVTFMPGAGDDVQALKAGIMEIADIFVVNKADLEGSDRLASAVEVNLSLRPYQADEWRPPVVKTVATSGQGVAELVDAISRFRAHAGTASEVARGVQDRRPGSTTGAFRRRQRAEQRLRELVSERLWNHLTKDALAPGELASLVDRIAAREMDPYTAADDLLKRAVAGPERS